MNKKKNTIKYNKEKVPRIRGEKAQSQLLYIDTDMRVTSQEREGYL